MRLIYVQNAQDLIAHAVAWDDLASAALEPNVFYESWHLLPALKHFGGQYDLRFVLIYQDSTEDKPPVLCGFFPLERRKSYKGIRVEVLALWKHIYCNLCTPLVRKSVAEECLKLFLTWLKSDGAPLLVLNEVSADGPFHRSWVQVCHERAIFQFLDECHTRALLCPSDEGENYIYQALARKRRKELKRQENRLADLGHLEYALLEATDEAAPWIETFLEIEASGWKGRAGTAFANHNTHRAFFSNVATEAHRRGQLMLLALRLNGKTIAMKFNLRSGEGAFACKIAFDEEYGRFSPGALLEIENIRRVHLMPQIDWMDSCAIPEHFMINRLWTERRIIHNQVISSGKAPGDLVVSLLPLMRWVHRKMHRRARREVQTSHTASKEVEPGN